MSELASKIEYDIEAELDVWVGEWCACSGCDRVELSREEVRVSVESISEQSEIEV